MILLLIQTGSLLFSNIFVNNIYFLLGSGLAGVLVSANRILTKALLNDERINTIIFFCVSIGILLACFIVFHVARRSNFVKFYVMLCAATADNLDHKEKKLTSQLSYTEDVSLVRSRQG